MAEQLSAESVIADIMNSLVSVIEEQKRLNDVKNILYINLSGLQLFTEETSLSTDIDTSWELLQNYLLDMNLRGCTKGSILGYKGDLKNFITYVNKPVANMTYADILKYLEYGKIVKKWSDRTYNAKVVILRGFFKFLYEEDFIESNPGKKLKETKVERKIGATITARQREKVRCACISERELALCDLLYSSGARISELCALNIDDIDFQQMSAIVYGKGRKEREIYFSDAALEHLERYLETRTDDNPALFVTLQRPYNRMSPPSARTALQKIKKRDKKIENIKLTPHVFRRSVGTDMINRGAPLELVSEKLGHEQMDTTKQCYAFISRQSVKQAHFKYVGQ